MSLRLRYAVRTDPGLVRQTNQDSVYAGPRLLAVADGMGGMAAGDLASSVVITKLAELDHDVPTAAMIDTIDDTVAAANQELHAGVTANPELRGMGTTLTALLISGRTIAMVHIGDSRAYLLRDGRMRQVTKDHTYVQMLVDEGAITAEEASNHPHRSLVTQVLQGEPIEPSYSVREAVPGDRYLLCSDGLSNVVTMETMAEMLREYRDPDACAERLIDLALRAGGPDNITAIVADILDDPEPAPHTETRPGHPIDADDTRQLPAVPAEEPTPADQPGTPRLYLSGAATAVQPQLPPEAYPTHVDPTWQQSYPEPDVTALVHPTAQPFPVESALPVESSFAAEPSFAAESDPSVRAPVDRDHPAAQFFPPAAPGVEQGAAAPRRPSPRPRPRQAPVEEPPGNPWEGAPGRPAVGPTEGMPSNGMPSEGMVGPRSGLSMPGSPVMPAARAAAAPPPRQPSFDPPVQSFDPPVQPGAPASAAYAESQAPAAYAEPSATAAHAAPTYPEATPPVAYPEAAPAGYAGYPDGPRHDGPRAEEPTHPERSEGRRAHPDAPAAQPAPVDPRADWSDAPTASVPTVRGDWSEAPTEVEDWSDAPTNMIPAVVDEWPGHPEPGWSGEAPTARPEPGWNGPSGAQARVAGTVTAEPLAAPPLPEDDPVASIFGADDDRDPAPPGRRSSRKAQTAILATLVILLVTASAVATWLFLTA